MILRGGVVQHQRISTISRISINSRISRFWCQFFCYLCNNVYTLSKFSIELNMSECKKVEVSGCWGCLTLDCQKPLHLWNLGKGGVTDVRTVEKFWHWWKFILWEIEGEWYLFAVGSTFYAAGIALPGCGMKTRDMFEPNRQDISGVHVKWDSLYFYGNLSSLV